MAIGKGNRLNQTNTQNPVPFSFDQLKKGWGTGVSGSPSAETESSKRAREAEKQQYLETKKQSETLTSRTGDIGGAKVQGSPFDTANVVKPGFKVNHQKTFHENVTKAGRAHKWRVNVPEEEKIYLESTKDRRWS